MGWRLDRFRRPDRVPGAAAHAAPAFKDLAGNKQIADGAIWAGIALLVVYFPITEGLWGRSLGKLLTGMVVVNAAGNPPGVGRAIIRTMTRLAEVNPFFVGGLPAAVFVALSKERQRLGDLMSGTYVIQSGELKRIKTLRTAASGKHFPT